MIGVIGNKQVLSQLGLIWREFGARCALRCVGAVLRRRRTTFLDIVFETEAVTAAKVKRAASAV